MQQSQKDNQTTMRRIANARRVLQSAGWTVTPPAPVIARPMLDQCEYPDLRGEPGDTCTHSTGRLRKTRHGTLWLCDDHFAAPIAELFDERLNHVE